MSERYSRLFSLPENLYAVGSPVIIAAGTLLKDNQTGKIVAQLKLRSISSKTVIGIKIRLCLFDNAGNPIGGSVDFDYLDLHASRDAEFGQKTPVPIAESKARSYTAAVTEVVFADRTTWTASDAEWEPLPRQKTLDAVLVNAELIKQYKIAVGSNFSYYPLEEKDLWYCACGALNHEGEDCHVCRRTLFELQTIDLDQLAKDRDARLMQEAADAEAKAAAEKAAAEAAKKKTVKILKIVIPVVCVVIAFVILLNSVIIPNSKYNNAVALMEAGAYEEAIAAFEAMDRYKDSKTQIVNCENAIAAAEQSRIEAEMAAEFARAEELLAAGDYDGAIAIYESLANYEGSAEGIEQAEQLKLEAAYQAAEAMMDGEKYQEAADAFDKISGYKNSADLRDECLEVCYQNAETLAADGKKVEAAKAFYQLKQYAYAWQRCFALWGEISSRQTIEAGSSHTVGVKTDGTVLAAGGNQYGQCDVSGWRDIVAVSAGEVHTVGLQADGTVVAMGYNGYGQCDVSSWTDIVAIAAGGYHTVGLRADGTVVAIGDNQYRECTVGEWTNIIAVAAGRCHTVGLQADGTVVAMGYNGYGQCDVSSWTDIVAIAAGRHYTVGLKADGTVVAVGDNQNRQCNVSNWTDIVGISAGYWHTVGLRSNGTVVAVGENYTGECDVRTWRNIVDITAGDGHTVAMKADGTVIAAGKNRHCQSITSSWTGIKLP